MSEVTPEESCLQVGQPVSLLRRGPIKVELTDSNGRCVPIRRRSILLRDRDRIIVKIVVPQNDSRPIGVQIKPDESLVEVVTSSSFPEGSNRTHQAEYRANLKSPLPELVQRWVPWIPSSGELVVGITDGQAAPVNITLPVKVRPSLRGVTLGILALVCYVFLVPIFTEEMKRTGDFVQAVLAIISRPIVFLESVVFGACFWIGSWLFLTAWTAVDG